MAKIPTTVVTGFLGAGKTTLIRHLLRNAGGRRLAVIVNEFGDLGVDRQIMLGCGDRAVADADIVELANGCICCTVADDFLPTMAKLVERADPPEHILVETSGLALPKPLLRAFNWPGLRTRATVDGVAAVVDAAALAAGRFGPDGSLRQAGLDHETPLEELFEEQLGAADVVLLNKADLLDPSRLRALEAEVRRRARPGVAVLKASHGQIDPMLLLGLGLGVETDLDSRLSHHETEVDHGHDAFDSMVLRAGEIADVEQLRLRLAARLACHDVLRLKGVLAVAGRPARLIVQAVGCRVDAYFDRLWRPDEARSGAVVVIGEKGLDWGPVRADLEAALI